jgi:phosphoribosylamine-glycine ligase|tara:strand:- start:760 stop:978 length:219 start_codon:yes stop_codon:yes gene_type:complete
MILKLDDINPDGVKVVINWDNMEVGGSVFVLCINTEKAVRQIKKIMTRRKWKSEVRVVVEDGKLGVRVWRTT